MNQIVGNNGKGVRFLLLQLEPGNIHRLKHGSSVYVKIGDHFPDGIPQSLELLIAYTDTPVADAKKWSAEAAMTFDERIARQNEVKPHCPECQSTVETIGAGHYTECKYPFWMIFCPMCGCVLGTHFDDPIINASPTQ